MIPSMRRWLAVAVVYHHDNGPGTVESVSEVHQWSVTVTLPTPVQDVDVELFGAARPGWKITAGRVETIGSGPRSFKNVPLTSLEAGHQYSLDSSSARNGVTTPVVTFTTDDLPRIGEGQVLASVDTEHSPRLMSSDSFVHERCSAP